MELNRALELVAARGQRLAAEASAPFFAASLDYVNAANAASDAPSKGRGPLAEVIAEMIKSLRVEASLNATISQAQGIAEASIDRVEVARWKLMHRGYRLPLP